ncbi:MAG: TIGR04372 family glycosyltransferase [Leptolyngbyaceae cyanobacterium]
MIRCLRPWRIIRLGGIYNHQIGHFVAEVGLHLAARQQQSERYLDLYWFTSNVCNQFFARLVRRNFLVYPRFWLQPVHVWNQILPGGSLHHIPTPSFAGSMRGGDDYLRDIHGTRAKTQVKMPFLSDEDEQAKVWLRHQGWQEGEPFVCLQVRDNAFKGVQGDTQDHRNSDIATYVAAAEWLAEQGVWVLRMGRKMQKPIPTSHPRIIDYAFHPEQSDFLDIWLFAHCDLCISTGSGPDTIADLYGRPILFISFGCPLWHLWSWSHAMHVPKIQLWRASGIILSCQEYLDTSWSNRGASGYTQQGIQVIDLTPEEILAAVQEQWQRLQGTWVDTEADLNRHHRFWEILKSYPGSDKYHGWIHPEARVGSTWLRSMGDAFLA